MKLMFVVPIVAIAALPPLLAYAVRGRPAPPPAPQPPSSFEEKWDSPPADKKQDALIPTLVRTIPLRAPAPEPAPPINEMSPDQMKRPWEIEPGEPDTHKRPARRAEPIRQVQDVCARHGLRRIETNGGRSWRCRR